MLFSSWEFLLGFLPVTLAVFFLLPPAWRVPRKFWLCGASLFFYGWWKLEYVPLLLFSIGFNYGVAAAIHRWRGRRRARGLLVAGVALNLGLLGYFKYANFLLGIVGLVVRRPVAPFDIALPLAISFFTFTQIGYIVDVSRDPERHYGFLDYFVFVVFFPHLIAGPIVRHWEVIPQYARRELRVTAADLAVGAALFLMGLCKKVLLADPVAVYANTIYGAAAGGQTLTWFDAWFGTLAYALQIYLDFSGYSDMAIGLARLFGIRFPCNFDSPYQAGSISDFWRRWHMTLTRFLRDYVYIGLGGNRHGPWRQAANILVTFLLSGLWHGAGWTFVLWGLLHGACVAVNGAVRRFHERHGGPWRHWSWRVTGVTLTFLAVLFTWVFFRAPNLPTAGRVVVSMVGGHGWTLPDGVTNPQRQPGRFLQTLGFQFAENNAGVRDYSEGLRLVTVLLALVWLLPNTQQWLARYTPTLEDRIQPGRLTLKLGAASGLAFGVLMFFIIRSHYGALPSPFLYFNF